MARELERATAAASSTLNIVAGLAQLSHHAAVPARCSRLTTMSLSVLTVISVLRFIAGSLKARGSLSQAIKLPFAAPEH
jgi:hypothetical protein